MSSLIDCPECACLFRASDATCPFCGHTQRHSLGSTWAAVAFTASLGVMGAACQIDRELGDETTATAGDTADTADTVDTSMVSESTNPGGETIDPTITTTSSDGATYAGPDEEWTTSWDTTTTTDTSTSTSTTTAGSTTTTTNSTNDSSDASTYAGPDEEWTTDDWTSTSDSSDASTYAGADEPWEPNQGR